MYEVSQSKTERIKKQEIPSQYHYLAENPLCKIENVGGLTRSCGTGWGRKVEDDRQRGPDFLHVKSQCYLQNLPLFNSWHLVFDCFLIEKCNNSLGWEVFMLQPAWRTQFSFLCKILQNKSEGTNKMKKNIKSIVHFRFTYNGVSILFKDLFKFFYFIYIIYEVLQSYWGVKS